MLNNTKGIRGGKMLYEDKEGNLLVDEEVTKLSKTEISNRGIHLVTI